MTDISTNEVKAPPKKKRKVAKKRTFLKSGHRAADPPVIKAEGSPFAGLTVNDCCKGCNVDGCVISGKSYCAHPRKGGLHAAEMHDDGAMRRRRSAERYLGNLKLVVE